MMLAALFCACLIVRRRSNARIIWSSRSDFLGDIGEALEVFGEALRQIACLAIIGVFVRPGAARLEQGCSLDAWAGERDVQAEDRVWRGGSVFQLAR